LARTYTHCWTALDNGLPTSWKWEWPPLDRIGLSMTAGRHGNMGGTRRAAAASVAAGMHPWTIDGYGWMEKHAYHVVRRIVLAICDDNATDGWKNMHHQVL